MKILHLDTGRQWRGGQQQVAYLMHGLSQRGHENGLAALRGSPLASYALTKGFTFHPLALRHEWDILAAIRLIRLCRHQKYTLLHSHDAKSLGVALLAKFLSPSLILVASRRVDFSVNKPLLGAWKYKTHHLNHIITVSEKIRQILINDGVPPFKITTIHSGIDLHKFDHIEGNIRAELGIAADHFIIGTVAALADHKDYPTLLRAAQMVLSRAPDVTFVALGSGPDEKHIKSLAEKMGLNRFLFVGFRPDVGRFLKSFDIFVLASKNEGLGTSLIDACAVGLPVVATMAGGICEIITDGVSGLLSPPQRPDLLAENLLRLRQDSLLRQHLSTNAKRAARKFDIAITVNHTLEIYQTLSENRR